MDFEVDAGDSQIDLNNEHDGGEIAQASDHDTADDGTIGQLQNGGISGMYTSVVYFNVLMVLLFALFYGWRGKQELFCTCKFRSS